MNCLGKVRIPYNGNIDKTIWKRGRNLTIEIGVATDMEIEEIFEMAEV